MTQHGYLKDSRGYFADPLDAPVIEAVAAPVDHDALSGRALEEMSVQELRRHAAARGVAWRGMRKPELVKALRA